MDCVSAIKISYYYYYFICHEFNQICFVSLVSILELI